MGYATVGFRIMLLWVTACLINDSLYEERKHALTDHDGDGASFEDDCDDADPGVSPEATEHCDGVDEDCDGVVDEDAVDQGRWHPDADGDGYGATSSWVDACEPPGAYVAVVGDCDDAAASVHPNAEETWGDGFTDNDCDGEMESVTFLYGGTPWVGEHEEAWLGRRLSALGDVTGDGLPEYLAAALGDSGEHENGGAVYLISGTAGGSVAGLPELTAPGPDAYLGTGLAGGADVDGDGVPDLLVSAPGIDGGTGAAWVVSGGDFVGSTPVELAARQHIGGDELESYAGSAVVFVGDVMGDGTSWIGVSAPMETAGGVALSGRVGLFDPQSLTEATLADADVVVDGYYEGALLGNDLASAGDLNADGYDDFLVSFGAGDLAAVLPGGLSRPTILGDALFRITGTGDGEWGATHVIGDVDADGHPDLVCIVEEQELYFFTHLLDAPLETPLGATASIGLGDGSFIYQVLDLGDLDGDGRAETLVPVGHEASFDAAVAAVVEGEAIGYGQHLPFADFRLLAVSSRDGLYGYRVAEVGDVDGDGASDVAVGGFQDDAGGTDAGGVIVVPVPH